MLTCHDSLDYLSMHYKYRAPSQFQRGMAFLVTKSCEKMHSKSIYIFACTPSYFRSLRAVASSIIGRVGGLIFIYSGSAQLVSFEINCFYGLWTRIYEYQPPPPIIELATALTESWSHDVTTYHNMNKSFLKSTNYVQTRSLIFEFFLLLHERIPFP